MTEAEWLTCTDPKTMLNFLNGKVSNRKLWLTSCGCCRRQWHLMDARCRYSVQTSERYADGQANDNELLEASEEAFGRRNDLVSGTLAEAAAILAAFAVVNPALGDPNLPKRTVAVTVQEALDDSLAVAGLSDRFGRENGSITEAERSAQADLIRDVFGNPLQPATCDPNCRTSVAVAIAQSIYDSLTFERMPELSDTLEKAGCTNAEMLEHCRGRGRHVRGCWVLDFLLGKK